MSDSLQPHGLQPAKLLCSWDSPGKNTRVGCHSIIQGMFPTQRSNPGLHCRHFLYHLSRQGSADPVKIFNVKASLNWNLSVKSTQLIYSDVELTVLHSPHGQHWRRKQQPTPVLLPGKSQGQGSLVGCHLQGLIESDLAAAEAAAWPSL